MGTRTFKPHIAILTNLYDAHLDYHGTFDNYAEAKFGVTRNQTAEDYFIYNADQEIVSQYAKKSNAQLIPFTIKGKAKQGISADQTTIYWNGEAILERRDIVLPGEHNLQNILCAVAACLLHGCEIDAMKQVLTTFGGVRHRSQFVREWNGRKIYNDSKATNCLATKSALSAFQEAPIVLWAGVGLVRTGAGTALVGDPDTVAARIQEYADLGIETFIFSGYPHLEEAYTVAELLFPKLPINQKDNSNNKTFFSPFGGDIKQPATK